jgi:hypothetical protein
MHNSSKKILIVFQTNSLRCMGSRLEEKTIRRRREMVSIPHAEWVRLNHLEFVSNVEVNGNSLKQSYAKMMAV